MFKVDLLEIKHQYKIIFKKDLVDEVKSETSGDYEKILVELLNRK